MNDFTLLPYRYRVDGKGLTKWGWGESVVNPRRVDYRKAIADFVGHEGCWQLHEPPQESKLVLKPAGLFNLSWLFPSRTREAAPTKAVAETAPALFDARVIVRMRDVSFLADRFNDCDTRDIKAHSAVGIALLISKIKRSAEEVGGSPSWSVSEIGRPVSASGFLQYNFTFTVQLPETVLNRMRQPHPEAVPA
jgi:hypothetical protein